MSSEASGGSSGSKSPNSPQVFVCVCVFLLTSACFYWIVREYRWHLSRKMLWPGQWLSRGNTWSREWPSRPRAKRPYTFALATPTPSQMWRRGWQCWDLAPIRTHASMLYVCVCFSRCFMLICVFLHVCRWICWGVMIGEGGKAWKVVETTPSRATSDGEPQSVLFHTNWVEKIKNVFPTHKPCDIPAKLDQFCTKNQNFIFSRPNSQIHPRYSCFPVTRSFSPKEKYWGVGKIFSQPVFIRLSRENLTDCFPGFEIEGFTLKTHP